MLSLVQPALPVVPTGPAVAAAVTAMEAEFGEELLPVPKKLQEKIVQLKFVEMRELLPEPWQKDVKDNAGRSLSPRKLAGPVTDILQWVQCFTALVVVLS